MLLGPDIGDEPWPGRDSVDGPRWNQGFRESCPVSAMSFVHTRRDRCVVGGCWCEWGLSGCRERSGGVGAQLPGGRRSGPAGGAQDAGPAETETGSSPEREEEPGNWGGRGSAGPGPRDRGTWGQSWPSHAPPVSRPSVQPGQDPAGALRGRRCRLPPPSCPPAPAVNVFIQISLLPAAPPASGAGVVDRRAAVVTFRINLGFLAGQPPDPTLGLSLGQLPRGGARPCPPSPVPAAPGSQPAPSSQPQARGGARPPLPSPGLARLSLRPPPVPAPRPPPARPLRGGGWSAAVRAGAPRRRRQHPAALRLPGRAWRRGAAGAAGRGRGAPRCGCGRAADGGGCGVGGGPRGSAEVCGALTRACPAQVSLAVAAAAAPPGRACAPAPAALGLRGLRGAR